MLRTRLPWLFLALAVASPPLWFWYVSWSLPDDDYEGTGAGIGFFIFLPLVSLIFISLFVTLAALTWKPVSEGSRSLKLLTLVFFGGASLVAGFSVFALFAHGVANAESPVALTAVGGTALLLLGAASLAARESLLEMSSDDPGEDGEGGATQFVGRHRR